MGRITFLLTLESIERSHQGSIKKVYEMMTVKESGYLKGFEEMLGVDNTMFEVDDDGDLVVSEQVEDPVTKNKKKIKVDKETGEVIE